MIAPLTSRAAPNHPAGNLRSFLPAVPYGWHRFAFFAAPLAHSHLALQAFHRQSELELLGHAIARNPTIQVAVITAAGAVRSLPRVC